MGTVMHARRVLGILLATLLLAASPAGTSPAPADARTGCPDQPLNASELLALWDDGDVLGFMGYVNPAGRECFGRASLRVVGYVNDPGAMGFEDPYTIEPAWLTEPGLFLYDTSRETGERPDGEYYPISWPGGYLELQERYMHSWVVVTAHFDDARARTCTATDPTGMLPPLPELREQCRSLLVISSVSRATGPDSSTVDVQTAAAGTPSSVLPTALLAIAGCLGALAWSMRRRRA